MAAAYFRNAVLFIQDGNESAAFSDRRDGRYGFADPGGGRPVLLLRLVDRASLLGDGGRAERDHSRMGGIHTAPAGTGKPGGAFGREDRTDLDAGHFIVCVSSPSSCVSKGADGFAARPGENRRSGGV